MTPFADSEIRLGLWRIHILHHAAQREVWGLWLLEELAEHGHMLSPGTLYPALLRMQKQGWIERSGDAAHARARQTFRITPAGRRLLETLRRDISELHAEVVLGREPAAARASRAKPDTMASRGSRRAATSKAGRSKT